MNDQFKKDVDKGLSSEKKFLSSKYFYDEKGDSLFVQIMNLPEYYLTRSEFEIFSKQTDQIIKSLNIEENRDFEIIELGAGDGTKTIELLQGLLAKHDFEYIPIDISKNALQKLNLRLDKELPELNVRTLQGDYFDILDELNQSDIQKIILFLGSNIGNLTDKQSKIFLEMLSDRMNPGDKLLLGVDTIKSAEVIIPAYNDAQGITAEFNLNLLDRINRELGADFNRQNFKHIAYYTEEEGIAKSFIESTIKQSVTIESLNKTFTFDKGERIHTEISRKYNDEILKKIIADSSLKIEQKFTDSKKYFTNYLLKST